MRDRLKQRPDFRLDQMFETHSEEWERVGLAVDVNEKSVQNARRRAVVEVALFVAVIVVFNNYEHWFHLVDSSGRVTHDGVVTAVRIATVLALLALGWAIARDIGRLAGPTFFRRMDPGTAGTVGFLVRLVTVGIVVLVVLGVAGVSATSIVAGSAFTAVIVGLAAQQTLGNLFAGMVLLSARPFRVGERVRLQAGAVAGQLEGVVSSLGLLYTTLARGSRSGSRIRSTCASGLRPASASARCRRSWMTGSRRPPAGHRSSCSRRSMATTSWSGLRPLRIVPTTALDWPTR